MEFNGSMYLDGYGVDAIKAMLKVTDMSSFEDAVETFNVEHHNVQGEDPRKLYKCEEHWLDNI